MPGQTDNNLAEIHYFWRMARSNRERLKVGISIGDLNGIGAEVVFKTFMDPRMFEICTPVVYGSSRALNAYRKQLGFQEINLHVVKDASKLNAKRINVVETGEERVTLALGEPSKETGAMAFASLKKATEDLAVNHTDVLVTAPINKDTIRSEEFQFPGHTEYLANYANEEHPLMILVHDNLRVGVATGHIPVKKVAETLTIDLLVKKLEVFNKSLIQDFGIDRPKLAVLGLNPHAGDNGVIGDEEKEIIIPAMKKAQELNIFTFGPFPADGFFGSGAYKKYDGVLGMYHDQGLVPFKSISFDAGVNYTAGLPIVRTSPDHGTGYDIAGKGIASESSFRNAIYLASDVYANRKLHKEMSANPLIIEAKREKKR